MPVLRNSNRSFTSSTAGSIPNISGDHLADETFKKEYEKIIAQLSTSDIKNCLKSSKSEARFYGEICNEELMKLKEEKAGLEREIEVETEINRRKDAEAAKLIKKLWQEANKLKLKGKSRSLPGNSRLKPEDVKKVWQEAKKMSLQAKQKRRKLLAEKNELNSKIQLARQATQFCNKFGR